MKFVIMGWDGPDGQTKRPIHRQTHLNRLKALEAEGRLVLAGPFLDRTGSLIVIEADSQEEAEAFARNDPYTIHGVFTRVEVHPFEQVIPHPLGLHSSERTSPPSNP
ncbi:MAG: hypothetical protein D6704_03435 [Nitrospirae bacterium]|nr:MAG: hypothetical protein D6704_03435 [Nitrospirota bacterium]